jgi:hypothetical protein
LPSEEDYLCHTLPLRRYLLHEIRPSPITRGLIDSSKLFAEFLEQIQCGESDSEVGRKRRRREVGEHFDDESFAHSLCGAIGESLLSVVKDHAVDGASNVMRLSSEVH